MGDHAKSWWVVKGTLRTGTPRLHSEKLHCCDVIRSLPSHVLSVTKTNINRNLGEGLAFPQKVCANLIWISWGQDSPADTSVTETILVLHCWKSVLAIPDHKKIILSLDCSWPRKRQDPFVLPSTRIIFTELNLKIRPTRKEITQNKPQEAHY